MIEVKHLTKRYGTHTAVSDLSFTVEKGQIYGFLGPNGAGKSTTMNIMTGCLAASSGEVLIDGHDIFEQAEQAKMLIGYLPEQPPLYLDRTPEEYLRFVAEAKRIPADRRRQQIEHVMELTKISDVSRRLIKSLSKGYRQRVGIAQAILGDPEIIILDEPTVGLDPKQIIEIRDMIKGLGKNHTVILSSHILSEVQAICQTILIISKGELVACDTPANLEKLFSGSTAIQIQVEASAEEIKKIVSAIPAVRDVKMKNAGEGCIDVTLDIGDTPEKSVCRELSLSFSRAQRPILSINTVRASLEDIFIELTSAEAEDREEGKKT